MKLIIAAVDFISNIRLPSRLRGPKATPDSDEEEESSDEHVATDIDIGHATHKSLIEDVIMKLNGAHPNLHPTTNCTIFKVPENIRQNNEEAYTPSVVTIGPFHYGSRYGSIPAMQGYKWRCLRYLLSRHQSGSKARTILNRCLLELKARDDEVRKCYAEKFESLDSQELASIMLSDGCFILYLLLRQAEEEDAAGTVENKSCGSSKRENRESPRLTGTNGREEGEEIWAALDIGDEQDKELNEPLPGNPWTWNLVVYDLLKLENQIPFFIIRILFKHLKTPADQGKNLVELALLLFINIHPSKSKTFRKMPRGNIHHLLHLFHSSIVIDWKPSTLAPAHKAGTYREWIPTATDLAMAGVKFRRKKKFNSFLDASFQNGVLEIPRLRLYDYTNSLFRNLIALEQCYPKTNSYVTNYAHFMDCIVDTANDVRLLDLKEILIKGLGTDEEVARLFNQLCNQIHYDPKKNYLKDVFEAVMKYHESRWHRWRAVLAREYLSTPWAIISLLVAALLLLLTTEQSIIAAIPYVHHHKS